MCFSPPCVIKLFTELGCDQARLVMSQAGAMKLHQAEPQNGDQVSPQDTLMGGMPQIATNVGSRQAEKIINAEMRFRINFLVCHSFTPVPVEHAARRFVMDMNHFSFRYIGDLMSLFLGPFRPGQVLQPGQGFIVGMLRPEAPSDGGVCIITESSFLAQLAQLRIPLVKDLFL